MTTEPKLEIDKYGTKRWYLNGKYHRKDAPAIVWPNGTKYWFLYGKLHRTPGPAIVWLDGSEEWHVNGKLHRTTGPAVIQSDGFEEWYKEWYLNDRRIESWIEYQKQTNCSDEDLMYLKLKYGANI